VIKVSDYIMKRVADLGIKNVFMITGGGAMHLDDSIGKEKRIKYICNHHEQACAIAVEGYTRVSGKMGMALVTTGPGGTNTITGVLGLWQDSIPALFISGQVKYETTVASTGLPLRQLGDQEAEIIKIVKPITKYAVMVTEPESIRYHFEKAVYLANNGRPGPVWLDIPLNVQGALIDEKRLKPFNPKELKDIYDKQKVEKQIQQLIKKVSQAERPVILAGSAIRTANACDDFYKLISKLNIPVLTAWNAPDLLPNDHKLFFGRPSTIGDRAGNFIIQNSDLLISLGCRLNIRQIGYEFKSFAREAYRVVVDIDSNELKKPTIFPHLKIQSDVKFFINTLEKSIHKENIEYRQHWLGWCAERKKRYPVVLPKYWQEKKYVNPYALIDHLSDCMEENDVLVTANGAASVVGFQAFRVKRGQRLIANSGTASMGYDIPAAIGACFAHNKKRVVCLAGDGSIQMNIQELQTIAYHKLPIKILLFNNNGYLSIRQTQDNMFSSYYVGESPKTGVSLPDMVKIAKAYGIKATKIENNTQMKRKLRALLDSDGPVLCELIMSPKLIFAPKASSQKLPDGRIVSKPLEDMYPFLDRNEFNENMIISEWIPKI